jgi:hypothetical protein
MFRQPSGQMLPTVAAAVLASSSLGGAAHTRDAATPAGLGGGPAGLAGGDGERMFYRFHQHQIRMDGGKDDADDQVMLNILGSTDRAVDMGGWYERLVHDAAAVEMDSATALLLMHRSTHIAGTLHKKEIRNGESHFTADLLDGARLDSGVLARDAIDSGALRGVSIGYTYHWRDTTWDDKTETLTVHKWRLLEVSLTPIPADGLAGLRERPAFITQTQEQSPNQSTIHPHTGQRGQGDFPMNFDDWLKARGIDKSKLTDVQLAELQRDFAAAMQARNTSGNPPPATTPPAGTGIEPGDEGQRASLLASQRENTLRAFAQDMGVTLENEAYRGFDSLEEGYRAIAQAHAQRAADNGGTPTIPLAPSGTGTNVVRDQADKFRARATAGLMNSAGVTIGERDVEHEFRNERHMGIHAIVRACAKAEGIAEAEFWGPVDCASYAQSRAVYSRAATTDFTHILSNSAEKALVQGFMAFEDTTYQRWCTVRSVSSFKTVKNAGLSLGTLKETAENAAFQELTKADGGYDSSLGMFGAAIALTFQALVGDDLGAWLQMFMRTGSIGRATVEKEAFKKLLNATYTHDRTGSAAIGTAGNLDKVRADFSKKKNHNGDRLHLTPRFLIHDIGNTTAVQQALGIVAAGGQTIAASNAARSIVPIESAYVSDTGLLAGALSSDYYLVGNPNIMDSVLVNFLEGIETPMIMPFDAGAVAAEKWKVMLPFQATTATHSDGTNTRVSGIQKATAAA